MCEVSGQKGEGGNETMGFRTMRDWILAWNVCLVPVVVVEIWSRQDLGRVSRAKAKEAFSVME